MKVINAGGTAELGEARSVKLQLPPGSRVGLRLLSPASAVACASVECKHLADTTARGWVTIF